jgi:hypothetical protein
MGANRDFRDLFAAFAAAEVRCLVVGAYAVMHYTEPRYTKDLDVWVEPSEDNARRVVAALSAFGAPLDGVSAEDFTDPSVVFQVGIEPNRFDVLTAVAGLDFATAWEHAVTTAYSGVPIRVLSLDDVITAKAAAGRPQDRLDLKRLARARDSRSTPAASPASRTPGTAGGRKRRRTR